MRVLALLLIVACSSSSPRPASAPTATTGGSAAPAAGKGCPATFAAAAGPCSTGEPCTYPEGACSCGPPEWCGGAAPPEFTASDYTWRCTPKVRADGCPGSTPSSGTPCSPDGKTCDYTCSCSLDATCTSGKWVVKDGPCKP